MADGSADASLEKCDRLGLKDIHMVTKGKDQDATITSSRSSIPALKEGTISPVL